jgi:predicted AlkP superfamily phosphohydrolase/phosphomutase
VRSVHAVLLLAAALLAGGCRSARSAPDGGSSGAPAVAPGRSGGRLVVLALDGLDFASLERWMAEGRLPGFAKLQARGAFSWLRTTEPPTTEAAWTAFVTGLPPAESGVVGPVRIDHATYAALPGTVEVSTAEAPPRVTTRRSGSAFWTALDHAGIRVRVLWAPYELPPERLEHGEVLAGAGSPDLAGTPGRSMLLGAAFPEGVGPDAALDRVRLLPSAVGWSAPLPGPRRPGGERNRITVPFELRRTADPSRLVVALPDYETELPPGVWSARMPVSFSAGDLRIDGLARFLVLDASTLPLILAAPLEASPATPWFPIADPPGYVAELAGRYGRVPTLGTPGDLAALAAGTLPEEAFLADLADDLAARSKVVLGELERGEFDFFLAFVPTVERATLGLRRLADPDHPRWDEARSIAVAQGFGGVRLRDAELAAYAYVDDLVDQVARRLAPDDVLLLVSQHGPRPWRRSAHLNAWLRREGLLVLKRPAAFVPLPVAVAVPGFSEIDWTRTQAYALGGPYIDVNLQGREGEGTVEEGERYEQLVDRMVAKLQGWIDENAGAEPLVRRVLVRKRELRGRREDALPDLVLVFAPGWRESAETVQGLVPEDVVSPNRTLLGADYGSGDAADGRGFLFSTRPFVQGDPGLEDLGATALGFFGAGAEHGAGRDLWRP